MKKFAVILLTVLLALVLGLASFGCGNRENGENNSGENGPGNEQTQTPETDAGGNTIIEIMVHVAEQSAEGMAYKRVTDGFNASSEARDNKIRVRVNYQPRSTSATGYETILNGMLSQGNLPDIITFDAPNTWSYANSGILSDITDLISAETQEDFFEISKNTYQDRLYGLPIQESSAGIYYNKRIFREARVLSFVENMTADNPWDIQMFEAICANLKNLGKCDLPVDLQLYKANDETATYLLYPFILAQGGSFLSEDGMTATGYFNSAATVNAFQKIRDWVNAGYTSYDASDVGFYTGKYAMYLSSGWSIPEIENQYASTLGEDWGILPYPQGTAKASATGSWSFGITTQASSPEKAAIVLEWLVSTDSSVTITDATGMIPARYSAIERKNYEAGSPEYVLYDQLVKTGRTRPGTVAYPEFTSTFQSVINALRNSNSASQVVQTFTSELQNNLNRYGK